MPNVRASSGTMGHDEFADFLILQHLAKHATKPWCRNFPAVAAFVKFLEEFVVVGGQRLRTNAALGNIAAQRFARARRY